MVGCRLDSVPIMERTSGPKTINLTVTIDEANLILRGIGLLPFADVYQLVAKLQQQAGQQLERDANGGDDRRPVSAHGA